MRAEETDVAVIGGGPAGSSVATLLRQSGYRVTLLERERFPRPHVGESMLPGVLFALAKTGALERVEKAGFTRKYGATYIWGRGRDPWTIRFSEVPQDRTFTFQCDREVFDKLLLDHARDEGVDVREGHQITRALMTDGQVTGLAYTNDEGASGEVRARMCVDASGQWSVLGRQFRLREHNHNLRHVALFGHYHGGPTTLPDVLDEMEPTDAGNVYVVAVDDGWLWHIPLAGGLRSIGLVTDPERIRGMTRTERRVYWQQQIEGCEEYRELLEGGRWAGDFDIVSDWSFICKRFHGPGYLLVGDAACFVDPILASGIALALQGVLRATKAIRTSLEAPDLNNLAMNWYQEGYLEQANDFVDMANHWYHGQRLQESWFWTAHRLVDPSQNLSLRQAFVFISSGLAKDSSEESIRYMGGFTPGQLAVTYEALADDDATGAAHPAVDAPAPELRRPGVAVRPEEALLGTPALVKGTDVRAWMQETETGLRPVTRVKVPETLNGDRREILLSLPTLSVLNLMDGRRSGAEVAQTLAERFAGSVPTDAAAMRPIVRSVIVDLAAEGAVELG
ncbi:MAG: NAD(P)/FAD-dependent oxidoreductase [Chloroflexota bacterium]|nr:NAD(P)/FAD-dependent oxidoreductase [Chloroflexota bacterium]MDE2920742.1 NAD(P)/FAD-dependent oxidoreductase [Chloroflexota bacterium]